MTVDDAVAQLHADTERGLSEQEARGRLEHYGQNTIEEEKKNPLLKLLSYFWGPIPWMLEAACVLSGIGDRWEEFFVILAMLLINGGVGWWHEGHAAKAIDALKETLSLKARVVRNGKRQAIDAKALVPGDVVILRRGDVVPAVLVAAVVTVEVVRAQSWVRVLLFALILSVAGIPVALPAVLSVTMAVGTRRLAAQKAIVSRLAVMEELAGVEVLFSDKTGTLTRNELGLQAPVLIESEDQDELVLAAALTADRGEERDAIDAAILAAVDPNELATFKVEKFEPFDSTRKRAEAQVTRDGESFRVAKGAPQVLLKLCAADETLRKKVSEEVDRLGASGFRALGVARKDGTRWRYLGLLSLLDPPREDSARVIADAKAHGVDVRMVTGDHQAIAKQVASLVGLGQNIVEAGDWLKSDDRRQVERAMSADGFAEVTPEDKFDIVERFQRRGRIVAMTGDGVNDAPALKKADVGFAVSTATDAARAASDIVLTEPGLGVIVGAFEEARRIFARMLSYATFRIAETMRMVLFIAGTIVFLGIHPVTAIMVAMLAILNDIPIMTIATDNTRTSPEPVRWNMRWVLADASILGLTGVVASALLLWFVRSYLHLSLEELQTVLFLKLLVAGHMTIYVTRVRDWFWRRPWPSWKLVVALEGTQVLGTLVTIFGWLVTPIPSWLALALWGYAIVWMFLLSGVRVRVFRKLRPKLESRHAERASAERAGRAEREREAAGRASPQEKRASGRSRPHQPLVQR